MTAMNRHLTSGLCITDNPHPGPPLGEGVFFCSDLTVASGRGMGPDSRLRRGVGCREWDVGNTINIKTC